MNINELALRMRAAAKNAADNFHPNMLVQTRDIITLVEALEKAKTKSDVYDMLRDDYGLREKGVGLVEFVDWQANRIAELGGGTVKLPLPSCTYADHSYPAYSKRQVISLLESLGITVVEGDV